jgi:hypothetical protein
MSISTISALRASVASARSYKYSDSASPKNTRWSRRGTPILARPSGLSARGFE